MFTEYNDISLLYYNTFGIDVKASRFIEYNSPEDLEELSRTEQLGKRPFFHIGGGSNLLFTGDYPGIILHSAIREIKIIEEEQDSILVSVGAGRCWDDFVAWSVNHNYYGVENLSLIPGEVGASAVQNIGAYGVEVKDIIEQVVVYDVLQKVIKKFSNQECEYAYRKSIFKDPAYRSRYIVVYVIYRLSKKPVFHLEYGNVREELRKYSGITLSNVRKAIIAIRENKLPDPKISGNAGSFFMNPVVKRDFFEKLCEQYPGIPYYSVNSEAVKIPAAWLIEQCGWKGKALGNVAVHDRQPLVLINKGGASGKEVILLAETVKRSVWDKFGIEISPEVIFI